VYLLNTHKILLHINILYIHTHSQYIECMCFCICKH